MMNKWIKTCKALKQLFEILSCSKCKKSLHDPQQFLNCGHFSCTSCINNENTSCVQCQLPCENENIIKDDAIQQILQTCCTIAKEIGFQLNCEDVNIKSENVSFVEQSDSKPSISGNILAPTNSKPVTNLPKRNKKNRKRKGNKNLNNNEDSKKAKYDTCSTVFRIPKVIDKTNHHGETKLQQMCKQGNIENIKALLDAGASPNVADYAKWTPLQETVDFQNYEVSKLLIERGANVNQPGFEGRTPLHEAAKNNNIELVKLLLKHKAAKDIVDEKNKRPEDYCQLEEIKKLLNCNTVNQLNCDAVKQLNSDVVDQLDCDEDIEIIYEKRNNDDNNTNNVNSKINHSSNNTNEFKNFEDFNSEAYSIQSPSRDVKEQIIKISNVVSLINPQENSDIGNTNCKNEIVQTSQDSINVDSEEIDIMN